ISEGSGCFVEHPLCQSQTHKRIHRRASRQGEVRDEVTGAHLARMTPVPRTRFSVRMTQMDTGPLVSRGNTYSVLRHGEAEQNVAGIVYGREDDNYALTPTGKEQVKTTVGKLSGITKIYASPIRR